MSGELCVMENDLKFIQKETKRKKLILVTDGFPVRPVSDAPFIIPELRELIKVYDVTMISCCIEVGDFVSEFRNEFESEVKVYQYHPPRGRYWEQIFSLLKYVFDPVFNREILKVLKSGGNILKKTFWVFMNYYWAFDYFKWFKRSNIIKQDEDVIYYTFWNQYYLFAMARHRNCFGKVKIVSRIHHYDLFQEESPMKWQPFKAYMDQMTDKTVFISAQGKEYYESQYRTHDQADKHMICRLGVMPQNVQIKLRNKVFLLVSCSRLEKVKRVEVIIQALHLLRDKEITWVHFGHGSEKGKLDDLVEKLLKSENNIKVEFKGFLSNEEILSFYKKNNPSCFITTSCSEGSPVSMQEAIAHGIPIIGTNVGGNYEMIDGNGFLLSAEPTSEEVADAIRKMYDATDEEYLKKRQRSLEIWKEKFNREKNNEIFIRMLEEL